MLLAAFQEAHYRITTAHGEWLLRVDEPAPELVVVLRKAGASHAALLTAFNPDGRRATPWRNRRAQLQLHADLLRTGLRVLAGRNEDPRRHWPEEPSFLVVGLRLPDARHNAARYRQAVFLWMRADGTPRLVETAAPLPYRR